MGSSGSGSFSDYSGTRNQPNDGGGSSGGSSGSDRCGRAFSLSLEDVALHDYFTNTGTVPAPGAILTIAFNTRVVAVAVNGMSVGALPTRFNYIVGCLNDGYAYTGVVQSSTVSPVPRVDVDFAAV